MAKLYGHLMVAAYRERYGLHASSGILYNHESPRRRPEFVTRKITRGAAAISLGLQDDLHLGNLDATRDWSFAGDVAEAMWLMLQQDEADDYVVCSGVSRTVRELVETAFAAAGVEVDDRVVVDPEFVRPPDPVPLVGDPAKARERLGWTPRTSFEDMIGAWSRPTCGSCAAPSSEHPDAHHRHPLPERRGAPSRRRWSRWRPSCAPGDEHLVVDGGSTDGTLELLRAAGVRFVSEPDRGPQRRDEQGHRAWPRVTCVGLAERRRRAAARRAGRRARGFRAPARGRVGRRRLHDHRRRRAPRSARA